MRRKCERITRKFPAHVPEGSPTASHVFPRSSFGFARSPAEADSANSRTRHTTHDTRKIKRREPRSSKPRREGNGRRSHGRRRIFLRVRVVIVVLRDENVRGSGVSSPDIFPEAVSFPFGSSGFLTGFPFSGWLGGGGGAGPGGAATRSTPRRRPRSSVRWLRCSAGCTSLRARWSASRRARRTRGAPRSGRNAAQPPPRGNEDE